MTVYSVWIAVLGEWELQDIYDTEEKANAAAEKAKSEGWNSASVQSHEVL